MFDRIDRRRAPEFPRPRCCLSLDTPEERLPAPGAASWCAAEPVA